MGNGSLWEFMPSLLETNIGNSSYYNEADYEFYSNDIDGDVVGGSDWTTVQTHKLKSQTQQKRQLLNCGEIALVTIIKQLSSVFKCFILIFKAGYLFFYFFHVSTNYRSKLIFICNENESWHCFYIVFFSQARVLIYVYS